MQLLEEGVAGGDEDGGVAVVVERESAQIIHVSVRMTEEVKRVSGGYVK